MDNNPEAIKSLHQQGSAQFTGGRLKEAKALYTELVTAAPQDAQAWYMLSTINGMLGNIQEAGDCARRALDLQPDHSEARINLGNVFLHQGRHEDAIAEYRRVIQVNPNNAAVHSNLGHLLNSLGKTDEALESYRNALRINPSLAEAHNNIGNIFLNRGEHQQAAEHLLQATRLAPSFADAHYNLGNVYLDLGTMDKALACYQRALELNPLFTAALNSYGYVCQIQGSIEKYIGFYRKYLAQSPAPTEARVAFIGIMGSDPRIELDAWLYSELLRCFAVPDVDHQPLAPVTAGFLKSRHHIQTPAADDTPAAQDLVDKVAADALFLMYLEKLINTDSEIELSLIPVRRHLLLAYSRDKNIGDHELKVIGALAHQGFNNEHVFLAGAEEQRQVSALKNRIERTMPGTSRPSADLERDLLLYCMYEYLYTLSCSEHLSGMQKSLWSDGFRALLERGLLNPLEEQRIKGEIESISSIEDGVSRLVQAQYEENPYPRWLSVPKINKSTMKKALRPHFRNSPPPVFLDGPLQILVAGCGTGKHPIQTAMSYDNVDITAVDISKSSLAYAIRMARKYRVDNIRFLQGDILQLGNLDRKFHIIECVGVLHHMDDPLKGWKTLTDLLVDDGLMYIGLYSELARKAVTAIGDVFRNEGLKPDRQTIRAFRNRVLKNEIGDNWRNDFDFFSMSGCRDLLLHAKEHRYTLPQIDTALKDLNLSFLSFIFRDGRERARYRVRFPQDAAMDNLTLWDQFEHEHPHTFARMYQFWCRKNSS